MSTTTSINSTRHPKGLQYVYLFTVLVLTVTGFGQMPIYRRYYISDIPGLGWSSDFYLTHMIHYLGAIFLIALFTFFMADYFLSRRKNFKLTSYAYVRIFSLGGLMVTGILRVMKNLPDLYFSPASILAIDLAHLMLAVVFLFSALLLLIFKKGWLKRRGEEKEGYGMVSS